MNGLGILVEEKEPTGSLPVGSVNGEVLLPPLPDELEDDFYSNSLKSSSIDLKNLNQEQVNFFTNPSYSTYELDSPSINNLIHFPSIEDASTNDLGTLNKSSSNTSLNRITSNTSSTPSTIKKTIKNGIRKLSLKQQRPILSPLQTDEKEFSSTSTIESLKNRSRTNSYLTPTTPPINSPIITISENLQQLKKNLSDLEQCFFESIEDDNVNSINELLIPQDLFNYSNYLKQSKKNTIEIFELTKKRLMESGWCSQHDLNNLQLQQDQSICLLDTKLLQIEEKLNQFDLSLLN